jgi:hypothetical protein
MRIHRTRIQTSEMKQNASRPAWAVETLFDAIPMKTKKTKKTQHTCPYPPGSLYLAWRWPYIHRRHCTCICDVVAMLDTLSRKDPTFVIL